MGSFNFDEWKFEFGEGNGKLGSSNTMYMKDIMNESDIFLKQGIGKPIITRPGIRKLMQYFKIYEKDFTVIETSMEYPMKGKPGEFKEKKIFLAKIFLGIKDDPNITFVGNGEVSSENVEDIGMLYPMATLMKRARSRGVLDFLGIDAYSEEESPEFYKLDSASDEQTKKLVDVLMKKNLKDMVKKLKDSLEDNVDTETMKSYIQFILDKEDITLANLTPEDLVSVIVGFSILKYTNSETFFSIMKEIKNDKKENEETTSN